MPDFEKQNRWLLNLRHEGEWGTRWKTTVNYSAVSDLDYLEDIGGDVGSEAVDKFVGPVDSSLANRRSAALTRWGKSSIGMGDLLRHCLFRVFRTWIQMVANNTKKFLR